MIDLTDSRQLFVDALMPDTCTISTPTATSDGGGAETPGTPTTTSSVCRFWTRAGRLEQAGDQVQQRGQYGLALPIDVVVAATATIQLGARAFRIVYQPPVVGLSFEQELGLEEVR